ncbi:hypothetical protein [Streptomyces anulatus]|uniref:hypothetical protein n=1 Tax=Streptomyces anulatus TaxID=1892 RepID=UPI00369F7543
MSTLILAVLALSVVALPVVVILSSTSSDEETTEDTAHAEDDCAHCAALTVPTGVTLPVYIPGQTRGGA